MVQTTPIFLISKYIETDDGGGSGFGAGAGYYVNYFAYERPSQEFMVKHCPYVHGGAREAKYVVIDGKGYYSLNIHFVPVDGSIYLTFQDVIDEYGPNALKNVY